MLALDALRAIAREAALGPLLAAARERLEAATGSDVDARTQVRAALDGCAAVGSRPTGLEAQARRFALSLARTVAATLLLEQTDWARREDPETAALWGACCRRWCATGLAPALAVDRDPEECRQLALESTPSPARPASRAVPAAAQRPPRVEPPRSIRQTGGVMRLAVKGTLAARPALPRRRLRAALVGGSRDRRGGGGGDAGDRADRRHGAGSGTQRRPRPPDRRRRGEQPPEVLDTLWDLTRRSEMVRSAEVVDRHGEVFASRDFLHVGRHLPPAAEVFPGAPKPRLIATRRAAAGRGELYAGRPPGAARRARRLPAARADLAPHREPLRLEPAAHRAGRRHRAGGDRTARSDAAARAVAPLPATGAHSRERARWRGGGNREATRRLRRRAGRRRAARTRAATTSETAAPRPRARSISCRGSSTWACFL